MKGGARGRVWGESPSARHLLFPYSRAGKQISYPDLVVPCSRLEKPPHLLATPSESPQSWEPRAGGRPPFQGHVPSSGGARWSGRLPEDPRTQSRRRHGEEGTRFPTCPRVYKLLLPSKLGVLRVLSQGRLRNSLHPSHLSLPTLPQASGSGLRMGAPLLHKELGEALPSSRARASCSQSSCLLPPSSSLNNGSGVGGRFPNFLQWAFVTFIVKIIK